MNKALALIRDFGRSAELAVRSIAASPELRGARLPQGFGGGGDYFEWNGTTYWQNGVNGPSTDDYDATERAGNPLNNSLVAALQMMQINAFNEAPPIVRRRNALGHWGWEIDHECLDVLLEPNDWWTRQAQNAAVLCDRTFRGDAYLYIVDNALDEPMELLWLPAKETWPMREPNSEKLVDWYDFRPAGGEWRTLRVEDVIHIRAELVDPNCPMRSLSKLQSLCPELCVDREDTISAAQWAKNMGAPGIMMTPKPEAFASMTINAETAAKMRAEYKAYYGGRNFGSPLISDMPWDFFIPNFHPADLVTDKAAAKADSRICQCFNVSPAFASSLLGVQEANMASLKQYAEMFYNQAILPIWDSIAAELTRKFLVRYEGKKNRFGRMRVPVDVKIDFDIREVRSLAQDRLDQAHQEVELHRWGLTTRGEGRERLGLDPGRDPDVYYPELVGGTMTPGGGSGMLPSGGGPSSDGGSNLVDGQNPKTPGKSLVLDPAMTPLLVNGRAK